MRARGQRPTLPGKHPPRRVQEIGQRPSWYDVQGDACATQGFGQAQGETVEAGLRGAVDGVRAAGAQAGDRGQHDDAPVARCSDSPATADKAAAGQVRLTAIIRAIRSGSISSATWRRR